MKEKVMVEDYGELRRRLAFDAEDDYREFVMKGIPSERPLKMFVSEVDHEKYPEMRQKYRFELAEIENRSDK